LIELGQILRTAKLAWNLKATVDSVYYRFRTGSDFYLL